MYPIIKYPDNKQRQKSTTFIYTYIIACTNVHKYKKLNKIKLHCISTNNYSKYIVRDWYKYYIDLSNYDLFLLTISTLRLT